MIVYDCEFPPDHHIEIRISHEIRTYSTVRGEAIKAVTKQIRKGKNIAKRAGQTPPDNEAMRGSISNALNELGAVASEGAQALRAFRSCERITKGIVTLTGCRRSVTKSKRVGDITLPHAHTSPAATP